MALFKDSANEQAYLKAGFMGFTGSGKTFTGSELAVGLHRELTRRKLRGGGDTPVFFLDTETGSDWVREKFTSAGIKLHVAKTRAFVQLVQAIREAEASRGIMLIDSITHFWRELTESYAKKKGRTALRFDDWGWLKSQWGKFTDAFVNSNLHIIMCGRAGYEYDFFEREDGKKELEKTGIKMRAEGETGYEPSILVLMSRHQELLEDNKVRVWRTALILKDRAHELDGKEFTNPSYKDFAPHVEHLNLGGDHVGVDVSVDSTGLVPEGQSQFLRDRQQAEIALEEVRDLLVKHYPGQSAAEKKAKGDLLEKHFKTRTWERIQTFGLDLITEGRNSLWMELEDCPYQLPHSEPVAPAEDVDKEAQEVF